MTTDSQVFHIISFVALAFTGYLIALFLSCRPVALDLPNQRSSHSEITPRSGGVAIVVTFCLGMLMIYFFGDRTHISLTCMVTFFLASLSIALISFLDDLKARQPLLRLAVMVGAACLVMWGGIVLDRLYLPGLGQLSFGIFAYPLTFIWILGLTNAVNFMDGLDGLVGGCAAIAALFFLGITLAHGSTFVYITTYTILAGTLGFLVLNFPPARIFMGDVGSVFLGFVFAVLAIIAARYDHSHTSFLVMPLLLFNIIFDTFFTFLRRLFRGENVLEAHRTHLYQLLQQAGLSHLQVSLIHYGFCLLQGFAALYMVTIQGSARLYVFLPFLLLHSFYARLVLRLKRVES